MNKPITFGATPIDAVLRCDGSSHCTALKHLHGCFADKGNCDEPTEHRAD